MMVPTRTDPLGEVRFLDGDFERACRLDFVMVSKTCVATGFVSSSEVDFNDLLAAEVPLLRPDPEPEVLFNAE